MENKIRLLPHRKGWGLSQQQVADLIGIRARSVISSYECGVTTPSLRAGLAFQLIFGAPLNILLPGLVNEIEEDVMRSALQLEEAHRERTDATAVRVREFLHALLERAGTSHGV